MNSMQVTTLRHIVSAESGANDGLAYPFVLLSIFMLKPV